MRTIRRVFQTQRPFELEQLTGLFMVGVAFLLYARPQSLAFVWWERLYSLRPGLLAAVGVALLLSFGYGLALRTATTARAFGVLTAPIAGYGFLVTIFGLYSNSASVLPGVFAVALWVSLQVAHDYAEAIKRWSTNSSSPSSHS